MKVTSLKNAEEIFKAVCDSSTVLCIDVTYPDAYAVDSMKVQDVLDYINESNSSYIFIAVED